MDNISGSAKNWHFDNKREEKEETSEMTKKVNNNKQSYTDEIKKLMTLYDKIEKKYNKGYHKDVSDSLVNLELTIRSLKNIN